MTLSIQDRDISVSYFKDLRWDDAFLIVEVELGLAFDLFYTKLPLVFSLSGIILRLLSFSITIPTFFAFLVLFFKNMMHYPKEDVIITFTLLAGAVFLEVYALIRISLSDRMMILLERCLTKKPHLKESRFLSKIHSFIVRVGPAKKRWSNSVGQYNLFKHCLHYMPMSSKVKWIHQYIDKYFIWKSEPVDADLKELIFGKIIRENAKDEDWVHKNWVDQRLRESNTFNEDKVELDQSILLWHVATDICFHTTETSADDEIKRERCRLLSNYMLHLMVTSPFLLPSGIGQSRFLDTCAEVVEFLDHRTGLGEKSACEMLSKVRARFKPSEVKGDTSKSLLFDACRLAEYLKRLGNGQMWETICEAWLDILLFAAKQCKWSDHVEKLTQGGELITHVWLLMTHFGMTDNFELSQGYIRAKLVLK